MPPQAPPHDVPGDEISLVDLAKLLIKRWKAMLAIFLVVVGMALVYALTVPRSFEYVSIYQVAEQAPYAVDEQPALPALEAPGTVRAKIHNLYLGPVTRELVASAGLERLPFATSVTVPEDTLLIRLSSEAAQTHGALVERLHEALLERVREEQQRLLEQRRTSLEQQLANAERSLEAALESRKEGAAELIASATNRVAEIQDRLSQLREGRVAQVAVQGLEPQGTSRSLIIALGLVLGAMLAVMGVFLLHFVDLVRQSLAEDALAGGDS